MYNAEKTEMYPSTDSLSGVFEGLSKKNIENALNEYLYQINGRVWVDEPENDDLDRIIQHAFVDYHPQIQNSRFELSWGTPYAEDYIKEFKEILEQEGLQAEIHERFRDKIL
ncbi:hypothetical protein [Halopiger aswanensis]|uniref:Uncharacterized protein n=1 Tax=Halopiger aswanensis TaxID=148449 RepID=A0A3R7EFP1_9EURY|nr:hypothetical protein [Halopiger aswanensis]RKD95632.1 hypothetical protein ATJ93_2493 [Halopiger aswanensis]